MSRFACGMNRTLEHHIHRHRHCAERLHELIEHWRSKPLRSVGERVVRVGVDLDHDPVRACGEPRPGERGHE